MKMIETQVRKDETHRFTEESMEDFDDWCPTLQFAGSSFVPDAMGAARDDRGSTPALSERDLIAKMIRELPPLAPATDASRPLACKGSNVFLAPVEESDPAPPWSLVETPFALVTVKPRPWTRTLRPLLSWMGLVLMTAIGIALWRDPTLRADVLSELARTSGRLLTWVESVIVS